MEKLRNQRSERGITLVALVVTIVVLLILAGITITLLLGDNGIIKKAQYAKEKTESAKLDEQQGLSDLEDKMDTILNGKKVEDNVGTVISTTKNTDLEDNYGNKITVPAGFHIVSTSEDSTVVYNYSGDGVPAVQDGIVVADGDENQFVWVPVGTINNKTSDTNGTTSTITLGRYSSFTKDSTTGLYTPVQTIDNYASTVTIADTEYYYQEDTSENHKKANTIAIDIGEFLTKANAKGGYYLARYEASYGSGYNSSGSIDTEKYGSAKPLSKPSTAKSEDSMNYTPRTLWNFITQPNAAIVAKNMYESNNYVSDLVNSYAWDTAIIFIQTYSENSTYASKKDGNGTLKNTGSTEDKVCNIYDMASNTFEWTTETSNYSHNGGVRPCTRRGGVYATGTASASYYTSLHQSGSTDSSYNAISFRLTLYVK